MTIRTIIDQILAYHPDLGSQRTCDVVIGSNPDVECTGILISIAPTIEIIRKAIDSGANFIFVHEPTFYSGYDDESDWLAGNDVYEEKLKWITDHGIVIFRDHDHMHAHKPDAIFHYVFKQLGWSEYQVPSDRLDYIFRLPETTLGDLARQVKQALGLDTIRLIGNLDAQVSTVGFVGHLLPNQESNWSTNDQVIAAGDCDVVIPGEIVEWTLPLYIRDAALLGKNKGMILPGHFLLEEAGLRWAVEWLRPLVRADLPITFISVGDLFRYL